MKLIFPDRIYLDSYVSAICEYRANHVETYAFSDPEVCDIFVKFCNYRTGNNIPPNRVPATFMWLVDGEEFVGEVSIRRALNDALMRRGGHIGYGVRYSRWNQGIGTMLLKMALEYAREELGLTRVLITCDDVNVASARVIEKNGGVLQDRKQNIVDGKETVTRRYSIGE